MRMKSDELLRDAAGVTKGQPYFFVRVRRAMDPTIQRAFDRQASTASELLSQKADT